MYLFPLSLSKEGYVIKENSNQAKKCGFRFSFLPHGTSDNRNGW